MKLLAFFFRTLDFGSGVGSMYEVSVVRRTAVGRQDIGGVTVSTRLVNME